MGGANGRSRWEEPIRGAKQAAAAPPPSPESKAWEISLGSRHLSRDPGLTGRRVFSLGSPAHSRSPAHTAHPPSNRPSLRHAPFREPACVRRHDAHVRGVACVTAPDEAEVARRLLPGPLRAARAAAGEGGTDGRTGPEGAALRCAGDSALRTPLRPPPPRALRPRRLWK